MKRQLLEIVKDHCLGLSYVAVSRVETLGGLLFEEPFDFERFKCTILSYLKSES